MVNKIIILLQKNGEFDISVNRIERHLASKHYSMSWVTKLYMAKGHTPILRPGSRDTSYCKINPLNAELNPICHLLALLGCATIVVVSRLRVNMEPRKDSLCPYEQKNRNRFISMHKKPSLFFVCFPSEQFAWEYCSSGFQH